MTDINTDADISVNGGGLLRIGYVINRIEISLSKNIFRYQVKVTSTYIMYVMIIKCLLSPKYY